MATRISYRLALDLGAASLGWCLVRLNELAEPIAIIRAGVRIFSDGRNPKDGTSLAVTRRLARQMRRRRDRLLKRKAKLADALVRHGFLPADLFARKTYEALDPYELRVKGLDHRLTPGEFGRAVFHLNQRRGFKSNRKTDRKDSESGLLKKAVRALHENLRAEGSRTVGEWLAHRHRQRQSVRARLRGSSVKDKAYDLYIDRGLIEQEFDALWAKQAEIDPERYPDQVRDELKGILLHQRPLRPVKPGRCTLLPELERAPLALPSVQRFRIYQEVNNLRVLDAGMVEQPLTRAQRDSIVELLEAKRKVTFEGMARKLKLGGTASFNLQDAKREDLKGNATSAELSRDELVGAGWHTLSPEKQDEVVDRLLHEEDEQALVRWLQSELGVDEARAEKIASARLPDGYGNLSREAIARLLPELGRDVVSYAEAAVRAGFHHSALSHAEQTGEVMNALPYYGEYLQRHVGFGTGNPEDPAEKRYGRIANPTVHIGLNQVRVVVNALLQRYGSPAEVVIEVARELKQNLERRREIEREQSERQRQNERWVAELTDSAGPALEKVSALDLQKMRLWTELNPKDAADRRCPYTGEQISLARLFSDEIEVDHILPFSRTLDDSLNNRTVGLRRANRDKGNRTPWEAFGAQSVPGYDYDAIVERAKAMPRAKAKRFAADGYQQWLRDDKDFLARALNDTAYLSRVAKEYLSLVCPPNRVRAIPGRLTALLRAKFGLNDVLGVRGEKNRNDHRHHVVDAAVIGVTDQGLLQRVSQASASAKSNHTARLIDEMPLPWPTYREHVVRAVSAIVVSHRPDHGYEGKLHNETAYGLVGDGLVAHHAVEDGKRVQKVERLSVIPITEPSASARHGTLPDGSPRPYKGYKGDSNYCIEIVREADGKWMDDVISTFEAYQVVRRNGVGRLRDRERGVRGKPLVMRLLINDYVRLELEGRLTIMRVAKISGNGQVFMCEHHEANVDERNRDKADSFGYVSKKAGTFRKSNARRVTVSPIGEVRDPGFAE